MSLHFSGSYAAQDVHFLLKRLAGVRMLDVAHKEAHIQSGGHYSEVLSPEPAPSAAYVGLFREQLMLRTPRMALDLMNLALQIQGKVPRGRIGLVSLARAGTPVGVLLTRALRVVFGRDIEHYSVSIIRDRGLDCNALKHVRARHADEAIVFVDGWTGKGVIGAELRASVEAFNAREGAHVDPALFVVADIAGTAAYRATRDDYLLPSAVLNATVSGLVSRTVLNDQVGPKDFHGCAFFEHLAPHDLSIQFVDHVWDTLRGISPAEAARTAQAPGVDAQALYAMTAQLRERHGLASVNYVKPGVGEATRVLLRRVPKLLIVRDEADPNVGHLLHLAAQKNVPVRLDKALACRAVALIEQLD